MSIRFGIKALSLAACLTLAGCMNPNPEETGNANAGNLKFANNLTASLAKTGATGGGEEKNPAFANACPKLAKAVDDLADAIAHSSDGIPDSFKDLQSCFDLPAQPTKEDYQKLSDDINADPGKFFECICGGGGLSANFDAVKWKIFSAEVAAAAGAAFNASQSNAAGASFNASSSAAAGASFNGSQSHVTGEGFTAQ